MGGYRPIDPRPVRLCIAVVAQYFDIHAITDDWTCGAACRLTTVQLNHIKSTLDKLQLSFRFRCGEEAEL